MGVLSKNLAQSWDRACKLMARVTGRRLPLATAARVQPVFVVAFGRSERDGLCKVLSASERLRFPRPEVDLPRLIKRLQRHMYRSWRYLAATAATEITSDTSERNEIRKRLMAVQPGDRSLAALIDRLYCGQDGSEGCWGATVDPVQNRMKRILEVFPDARFICLVRNGVEAIAAELSLNPERRVAELGGLWASGSAAMSAMAEKQPGTLCVLKYEDLLAHPVEELDGLCGFLGIEHAASMDDTARRIAEEHRLSGSPADGGSVSLEGSQLQDLSLAFSTELVRRGYDDITLPGPRFYSQYGQDRYLAEQMFPAKTDGFFVDIGAHDGVTYSNSKHFEELGWRGVCVEPNPQVFRQLQRNRSCKCVNACISEVSGEIEFAMVVSESEDDFTNMLSGIVDKYDKRHRRRLEQEVAAAGGRLDHIQVASQKFNECVPPGTKIDFVSIDTEGAELAVLQSIDFGAVDVECFVIENNYSENTIAEFMNSKGYKLHATLKVDQVFVRQRS